MVQQENNRRLTLQLEKEVSNHRSFRLQFQSTFRELESTRSRNVQEREKLQADYDQLRQRWKQAERVSSERIRALTNELASTIEAKDKLYIDTIQRLNTEHRVEIDSMHSNMLEEREIAITNIEVRAYEDMFQQIKKYEALGQAHRDLEETYATLRDAYEQKLAQAHAEHEAELAALQERGQYEKELSGENAKREYSSLQAKFQLELKSLKAQAAAEQQTLLKRSQEEKAALSNKLIGQYQAMLADQRSSTEIQLKQKLLQFQRKGKAFQKRIAQGEKRKGELKVTIQRMKLQSQMKIESMMQANEKLQEEIETLHERILELEKAKSTIINDYEFKLLLLRNEVDKIREDYHQREDELRAELNDRIHQKNREIARFAQRVKQDTEQLMRRNRERVVALEKEYEELKRVINLKTSLPEDIDALRVFHAAYIEKETELASERKRREELQRELHSKDAIEKVFVAKDAFKRLTAIDKLAPAPAFDKVANSTAGRFSFTRQLHP